jgi:hypothetical protein
MSLARISIAVLIHLAHSLAYARCKMQSAPTSLRGIEEAASTYGPTPAAKAMMQREAAAAEEALASGRYLVWRPVEEYDPRGSQCCARIGSRSGCLCGHSLAEHKAWPMKGTRRPPGCNACGGMCRGGFRYAPTRPEELGQWHLPRRKNFDLRAWQARVRERPQEYCCIG